MTTYALHPPEQEPAHLDALNWHLQALEGARTESLKAADIILCSDITQIHTLARSLQRKTVNVDPLMSPDVAGDLNRAILKHLPFTKLARAHDKMFQDWAKTRSGRSTTSIFGPGPSGLLTPSQNTLTIITGAPVVKVALEKDISVDAIVMSDSLALTGTGKAVKALQAQIITLQNRYQCALITTLANAAILYPHWPKNLQHLLIGVPESKAHSPKFSLLELYATFPTGNVLTALILPVSTYFSAPITLYGFDGALGVVTERNQPSPLAHKDAGALDATKVSLVQDAYGSGYLFPGEYIGALHAHVNRYIHTYQSQGHRLAAPNWAPTVSPPRTNSLTAKLYAATEFADTHPLVMASLTGLFAAVTLYAGRFIMSFIQSTTVSNGLTYSFVFAIAFVFAAAFLHLRKRAKRLADIAERRASAKAHRAFETAVKRLDILEAKLDM